MLIKNSFYTSYKLSQFAFYQCCASGSVGIVSFWTPGSGYFNSIIMQKRMKNLDIFCFVPFYDFLSVLIYVNVNSKSNKQTNLLASWKQLQKKSRIRIRKSMVRFHRSGSVSHRSLFYCIFLLFRWNDCSQFAVWQILVGCTWCRCLLPASTSPGCCLLFSTLLSVIYTETCCQVRYDKNNILVLIVF